MSSEKPSGSHHVPRRHPYPLTVPTLTQLFPFFLFPPCPQLLTLRAQHLPAASSPSHYPSCSVAKPHPYPPPSPVSICTPALAHQTPLGPGCPLPCVRGKTRALKCLCPQSLSLDRTSTSAGHLLDPKRGEAPFLIHQSMSIVWGPGAGDGGGRVARPVEESPA